MSPCVAGGCALSASIIFISFAHTLRLHSPSIYISYDLRHLHYTRTSNGAGEGVWAGQVDQRGAGAALPGGGRRRVRARPHGSVPGQGAEEPRPPRQKPVWAGPGLTRRGSGPLRGSSDREVRAPQVQDGAGGPAEGGRPGGGRHGGRVDGGGGAPVPPGPAAHHARVLPQPHPARHPHEPGGRRRGRGEDEEGSRDLRGAPVQAQVPRRRLLQLRGPQPFREHFLHRRRDAVWVASRLVPSREGLVGGPHVQALLQEDQREYDHQGLVATGSESSSLV